MNLSENVEAALQSSSAGWFKARTIHEHGVIARTARVFVDLNNANILDFGCGALPLASASFALRYPASNVFGTDIVTPDTGRLQQILQSEASLDLPRNLTLKSTPASTLPQDIGPFDLIYTWSVFEHIAASEIKNCFVAIKEKLSKNGVFYFQIGALYFSPEGPHISSYVKQPWDHLTLSICELQDLILGDTTRPARSNEAAWRQFIELNRLTADDFLDAARDAGLKLVWSETIDESREPQGALLRIYQRHVLKTMEIRALFRA